MVTNNNSTILFYAPLGLNTDSFKIGGAEAGCRKTLKVLQNNSFRVIHFEKPIVKNRSIIGFLKFFFNIIQVWLRISYYLLKQNDSILHIAGFYLNQVYFEYILIFTSKLFRRKCIYEIRNGGMIESFVNGSSLYKRIFLLLLKSSSLILCQGYDYVVFLKKNFGISSEFYPNYIMDNFLTSNNDDRMHSKVINLVYLGRVVPEKNIEFIIEICKVLKSHSISFRLNVIGGFSEDYYSSLNKLINNYDLESHIMFHGRIEFEKIFSILKKSHFFIFPSTERREGHSNALTESMGCGVVPITSDVGFNSTIIQNSSLIIPEFDAYLYSNRILSIWNNNQWKFLSDQVFNRISLNFTETIVSKSLIRSYTNLVSQNG